MKNLFVLLLFVVIFIVVKALPTKNAEIPGTSPVAETKEITDQDNYLSGLIFEIDQDGMNKKITTVGLSLMLS